MCEFGGAPQTMRYLALLPEEKGLDGVRDWSALSFSFDEEVTLLLGPFPAQTSLRMGPALTSYSFCMTHQTSSNRMSHPRDLPPKIFPLLLLLCRACNKIARIVLTYKESVF